MLIFLENFVVMRMRDAVKYVVMLVRDIDDIASINIGWDIYIALPDCTACKMREMERGLS